MLTTLRTAIALAIVLMGSAFLLSCGESSNVGEASCSACGGKSYTAEQCMAWGEAAGCKRATFVPGPSSGCNSGCSFENCDEPPMCGASLGSVDSPDATVEVVVDPRCERSDDGLFTSDPPCSNAQEFTLNGVRYYYCPCANPCPCGYKCGSIPLSVGGTIGSACAPE